MTTEQINHDPAHAFMNTGSIIKGRPSMGSWLLYGLGAETETCRASSCFTSAGSDGPAARLGAAVVGGVPAQQVPGHPVPVAGRRRPLHRQTRRGSTESTQRRVVEEINRLNGMLAEDRLDPEIHTRIAQYEMAFRMQASVPELTDFRSEPQDVLDMYGIKQPGDGSFASNCLLARRLAERGVRFIQLYHRAWDHHGDIEQAMPRRRATSTRPVRPWSRT